VRILRGIEGAFVVLVLATMQCAVHAHGVCVFCLGMYFQDALQVYLGLFLVGRKVLQGRGDGAATALLLLLGCRLASCVLCVCALAL
jgi:hypothetical protein